MLSNLLQELALARDHGQTSIVLDEARLCENPVSRLSRMIRHSFWVNLTRRIDADGLEAICADPKVGHPPPKNFQGNKYFADNLPPRITARIRLLESTFQKMRWRCESTTNEWRSKDLTSV